MGGGDGLFSSHFLTLNNGSLFGTFLDFALSFLSLLIMGARFFTVPSNSVAVLQAFEESSLSLNLFSVAGCHVLWTLYFTVYTHNIKGYH